MRSKSQRFLLVSFIAAGLAVYAQVLEPQIAGRVVRAEDGKPIPGATVQLIPTIAGNLNSPTDATNDYGEYRFQGVKAETYTVRASADGFVWHTYRRDESPEGVFQTIDESTRLRGIDFRLQREAVIRGVVTNVAGQTVGAGIHVAAVRKEKRQDGGDRFFPASEATTESDGKFVLKKLEAGSYFVCVNGPHGYNAARDADGWYRETWYRDKPSENGAIQIPLREGEEHDDVRINVERETRYRVIVWPSGPDGAPGADTYSLWLQGYSHTYSREADGSYVIPDVPPGHYRLASTARSGDQYVGAGDTTFDVSHGDVTVHVRAGGLGKISGIVKWAGMSGPDLTKLMIGIESQEGAGQGSKIGSDGSFGFSRVLPGHYEFRLLKNPGDEVIRSIRCGGATVTNELPLELGDRQNVADCILTVESTRR